MPSMIERFWRIFSVLWDKLVVYFFPKDQESIPTEEERILTQLNHVKSKLDQAWLNVQYAESKFVDIAIIEVNLAETEYSLLNRKYRMITGESFITNNDLYQHFAMPWLGKQGQNDYTVR